MGTACQSNSIARMSCHAIMRPDSAPPKHVLVMARKNGKVPTRDGQASSAAVPNLDGASFSEPANKTLGSERAILFRSIYNVWAYVC